MEKNHNKNIWCWTINFVWATNSNVFKFTYHLFVLGCCAGGSLFYNVFHLGYFTCVLFFCLSQFPWYQTHWKRTTITFITPEVGKKRQNLFQVNAVVIKHFHVKVFSKYFLIEKTLESRCRKLHWHILRNLTWKIWKREMKKKLSDLIASYRIR